MAAAHSAGDNQAVIALMRELQQLQTLAARQEAEARGKEGRMCSNHDDGGILPSPLILDPFFLLLHR
jgi:hypothetical protein